MGGLHKTEGRERAAGAYLTKVISHDVMQYIAKFYFRSGSANTYKALPVAG